MYSTKTTEFLTAELFLPALMLGGAAVLVFIMRRQFVRQSSGSFAEFLLRPAYVATWMILLICVSFATLRVLEVFFGELLSADVVRAILALLFASVILFVPYQWVNRVSRINSSAHPWIRHMRTYSLAVRLVLLTIFVLILLETVGIDIQALLVAGGIGGLIVGLALKELLVDFFSGVSLQATSMIKSGDVIHLTDKNIEGTVTDIGFRMTRLVTFERRPLLLPNSLITSSTIEQLSLINSRRIQFSIGLRYEDYPKIKTIVSQLRDEIPNRPSMVDHESSLIFFRDFGAHSLNILIRVFTNKTDYREYCMELEEALHHTASIIERNGAEFAFPTSVVHLHDEAGDDRGSER